VASNSGQAECFQSGSGAISSFDRSIRVWIGLAMIVGSIQDAHLLPWSMVGTLLVSTAWLGFCPLYAATGFQSRGHQQMVR